MWEFPLWTYSVHGDKGLWKHLEYCMTAQSCNIGVPQVPGTSLQMQQVDKGFCCIETVSLCFIHHFCIYSCLCISTVIWLCFCCFFLGTKFSVTIFLWRKCYIETGASVVLFCFSEKTVICDIRGCQLPIVFNICSCYMRTRASVASTVSSLTVEW